MFALFPPWKGAVMQGSCARDVVVMQWVSELCIFLPRITAKVVPAFLLCTDHQLVCAPPQGFLPHKIFSNQPPLF